MYMFSFFKKENRQVKDLELQIQSMMAQYNKEMPTLLSKTSKDGGKIYMQYFNNVLLDEHHPLLAKDNRKTRFQNDDEYIEYLLKIREKIYTILDPIMGFEDIKADIRNDKLTLIMTK